MSNYTPTTEDIRELYVYGCGDQDNDGPEFDRWLAQHDKEVTEATEQRIIKLLETLKGDQDGCCDECKPHLERSRHYLTALQDLIKGEK